MTTRLIYFSGPDNAGKTALANLLYKHISGRGAKVKLSWMRGTQTFAALLARFLSKFKTFQGVDNPFYLISIPAHLRRLWQILEFISIIPVLLLKYNLPQFLNYIVIGDRYLPDFLVWVALVTRDPNYFKTPEARFLLQYTYKAQAGFYVTADVKVLIEREKKLKGGKMSRKFIEDQLKMYDKIEYALNLKRIDTTSNCINKSICQVMIYLQN